MEKSNTKQNYSDVLGYFTGMMTQFHIGFSGYMVVVSAVTLVLCALFWGRI